MISKDRIVRVTNRDNGKVGYTIEDLGNLHRSFRSGQTKEVTFEELQKLSWIDGGLYLLKHCLVVDDKEVVSELLNEQVEPEYFYTEEDIKALLLGSGQDNMNKFLDMLDFAPDGVKDMIKELAVSLPCNDINKREAIKDKLHYDVTGVLTLIAEDKEESKPEPTRRAAVSEDATKPARRYTIIEN